MERPAPKAVPVPAEPVQAKPVQAKPIESAGGEAAAREELLIYADLLYSRKQYPLAIRQYKIFLKEHGQSPNAPSAWFRLGESYWESDQKKEALEVFDYIVKAYKQGPFVGSASYRLGVVAYQTGRHAEAEAAFALAAKQAASAELRLQASYYLARSQQLGGKNEEAMATFRQLVSVEGENPFRERSRLALCRLLNDSGDLPGAWAAYKALADSAKDKRIQLEAQAKTGLLGSQVDQAEASVPYLEAVLKSPGDSSWKPLAQVALIFHRYARGEYEQVLAAYQQGKIEAPTESQPRLLLMVANALRETGDLDEAIETYRRLEKAHPEQPEAAEAAFARLQLLAEREDPRFPEECDAFLALARESENQATLRFANLAQLLKGEWHFLREEWPQAANAYASIDEATLPAEYRSARLYKLGWSEIEEGTLAEGIAKLTRYLDEYPEDPHRASALAKRASAHQAMEMPEKALADYQTIADQHAKSEHYELALQQIAFIHTVAKEVEPMIAAYRRLLEAFPESSAAPDAHYWIGAGLYDGKDYQAAVTSLHKARELNAEAYGDKVARLLILCHFQLKQLDLLAKESDAALKADLKVPVPILHHLGESYFAENDFDRANRFFTAASTPDSPAETPSAVWNYLAKARLALKDYPGAITAADHYLAIIKRPSERARTMLLKASAQLAATKIDDARVTAEEALSTIPEGRLNAEARLMLGDISVASGDPAAAAKEYFLVTQLFIDKTITPVALSKAAEAYRLAGDLDKAGELKARLEADYPDYEPGKES